MIGQRFGMLVVRRTADKRGHWECDCDCGGSSVVRKDHLLSGATRSCKCVMRQAAANRTRTHGKTNTSIHHIWDSMLARCTNPNQVFFHRYGGRGVTVCDRWLKFENFLADMGEPPAGMTLDRIDNDGAYEPGNCRWATRHQQARNRSNNRLLEFRGEVRCQAEWAEITGIPEKRIYSRISRGWTVERALTQRTRQTGANHD